MAAAALPAAVALEAAKQSEGVFREFMAAMSRPIYSNLRVTTRSWTEEDKNGKLHSLTETKTKGWTIPLGLVLGSLVVIALWEASLAAAQAFNSAIKTADQILSAPIILAQDVNGAFVGILTQGAQAGQALWDWLDGTGASHSGAPPSAIKQVAMPATGMAAFSQAFIGLVAPIGAAGQALGGQIVSGFQNAGKSQ